MITILGILLWVVGKVLESLGLKIFISGNLKDGDLIFGLGRIFMTGGIVCVLISIGSLCLKYLP